MTMFGDWYGPNGERIDANEAERLLVDMAARRIALTTITTERGRIDVSTVHLVLDHGWGVGPPILWETMAFGGPDDVSQRRYRSRDEARTGHDETVAFCLSALDAEGVAVLGVETLEAVARASRPEHLSGDRTKDER